MHGGDFRKAGERSSGQLTLSRLRDLLEDDVRNLAKRSSNGGSGGGGGGRKRGENG